MHVRLILSWGGDKEVIQLVFNDLPIKGFFIHNYRPKTNCNWSGLNPTPDGNKCCPWLKKYIAGRAQIHINKKYTGKNNN